MVQKLDFDANLAHEIGKGDRRPKEGCELWEVAVAPFLCM